MLTTDVRHAPVEQQIAGGMLGVAALRIKSAEGIRRSIGVERDAQQHEAAGAIRLPHILAQRLQHGLLQGTHGVYISVEGGKVRSLLLNDGCHILREMDAHDRDIPPQGVHIRAKGPHLEGQSLLRFSPWAFELPKQKQGDQQHRQQPLCPPNPPPSTRAANAPMYRNSRRRMDGCACFSFASKKLGMGLHPPLPM